MGKKRYLYLMRHGQAESGGVDFDRALSACGKKQIKAQVAQFKKPIGIRPDGIFCSTARRTKETAESLAKLFKGVPVFYRETLYLAPTSRLLDLVREVDDVFSRILIIGHNPGLEQLVSLLDKNGACIPMKPADCITLCLNSEKWSDVQAGVGEIQKIYFG